MKWSHAKISDVEQKVHVTCDAVEVADLYEQAYEKAAKTLILPGFRAGKVPLEKVKQAMKGQMQNQVGEIAAQRILTEIVPKLEIPPISRPTITVHALEPDKKKEATFTMEYENWPIIEKIDLQSISVEEDALEVDDDSVQRFMEAARKEAAQLANRADAPEENSQVQTGDFIQISWRVHEYGDAKEKILHEQEAFYLQLGKTQLLPGMEQQLLGMKPEQNKTFRLQIPKDYTDEKFAGRDLSIHSTLLRAEYPLVSEWTDALAHRLDPSSKTIGEFKKRVKEQLFEVGNRRIYQRSVQNILSALTQKISFQIPPSMLLQSCFQHLQWIFSRLQRKQEVNESTYAAALQDLAKLLEKDVTTMEKEIKIGAEKTLRQEILLHELERQWKIEVSREEIERILEARMQLDASRQEKNTQGQQDQNSIQAQGKDVDKDAERREIEYRLRQDKLWETLYKKVEIRKSGKLVSVEKVLDSAIINKE